ncbi:AAA family ATPase [Rhizobium sp. RAF56]|uniref:AAA family ATPase n=1 Tax=Rhizobium sp. RAF56 TaxID=3233062 RepID=UPI003F9EADB2
MPVIAVSNLKGGAGKSTTTLVLATTLAAQGASVAVLDCDPNRLIQSWRKGSSKNPVIIDGEINENNISRKLDDYRKQAQFVFVDIEHTATRLISPALARARMVIIPMQASPIDAELAAKTINLIEEEGQVLEKAIPYQILFNRKPLTIATKLEKAIVNQLQEGDVPTFRTHLNERAAFKSLFYHQLDLIELSPNVVNGLPAARENALRLAEELVDLIVSKGAHDS